MATRQQLGFECYICGSAAGLQRHHLDFDHKNESIGNVVTLCQRCHVWIHRDAGYRSLEELRALRTEVERRRPERFQPTLFDLPPSDP